jgi:hypothetical protein
MSLTPLARALGLSTRSMERLVARRIVEPAQPGRGRRPALYSSLDAARRIIAHRTKMSARDRRERAQARLLELRLRRETREALPRVDVVHRGQAVVKAVTAALLRWPSAMVRAGVIPPEGEKAAHAYIREQLAELARLESPAHLTGDEA